MNNSASYHTHALVLRASVHFRKQPFIRPLLLSTGAIDDITQADAEVEVVVGGQRATGRGCIYLSDLWAWPDLSLGHAARDEAMQRYAASLAAELPRIVGQRAHPLAMGLRLHQHVMCDEGSTSPWPPILARAVCASPFDAAIHDAVGSALGRSAFGLFADEEAIADSDHLFGGRGGTMRAIRNVLLDKPRTRSAAWWIIGSADDLQLDVAPAVREHGYFAFKLKIKGRDALSDARRTAEVAAAARGWGLETYRLSIDSNEGNPDARSVSAYLDELKLLDPDAYDRLEMIEQPTGRDIALHAHDWQAVASRKPVMVDEGLLTLPSMAVARDQGWSGFALKSCKGHSFVLVAAAWAHVHGMLLSLQDLTNPGLAAVHAGLLAARLPTINGVELNSPQFTPEANAKWARRHPKLFTPKAGFIELPEPAAPGLGSAPADIAAPENPR